MYLAAQAFVSNGVGNAIQDISRCLDIFVWGWHWAEGCFIPHLGPGLSRPPEHCALVEEYLMDTPSFSAVPH